MVITHLSRWTVAGATLIWLSMFAAEAPAETTRPYQMGILASTDVPTAAGFDIPVFTQNLYYRYDSQPPGRSIALLPVDANLDRHRIDDWNRIVAVFVDEPYGQILKNRTSCDPSVEPEIADQYAERFATLAAMAAAVHARAPSARFWVNFTQHEIDLLRDPGARCPLNQPYIDVISMDIYDVDFRPALSSRYKYLYKHRASAHQQLALVPGTFTGGYRNQSGAQGAARLSGYFKYAAKMNQRCNLPLGPAGKTGIYDGCPVWMVMGWTGGVEPVHETPREYFPIDNPSSILVFNAWQAAFAVRRVDPSDECVKSARSSARWRRPRSSASPDSRCDPAAP